MPYLTGRRPAQEIAVQIRLASAFETAMLANVERSMSRVLDQAAGAIEAGGNIGLAVQQHERDLTAIYRNTFERVMPEFGGRILSAAGKSWRVHLRQKDSQSEFDQAVRAYIEASGARAAIVAETTRERLRAAILAGEADGMSQREIASQIRRGVPDLPGIGTFSPRVRAAVIARTEVHTASTVASSEAAKATGVVQQREWVSAEDARTRADHSAADGQKVGMGERYEVGGTSLAHPGDPNGPASQVVSCRCVEAFVT